MLDEFREKAEPLGVTVLRVPSDEARGEAGDRGAIDVPDEVALGGGDALGRQRMVPWTLELALASHPVS